MDLESIVKSYPGFPKEGIVFRDFGPVLGDPQAMRFMADEFGRRFDMDRIDLLAGIESRGFILAALLGARYNKGMVMIRKPGKLPGEVIKRSYHLEYGDATVEIQKGSIRDGQRVLICDDLIATGGTAMAAAELIEEEAGKGAIAGFAFIIELSGLGGTEKIAAGYRYESLIQYQEEAL